ncbi:MAG: hypothetical protein ACYDAE_10775 [Steroidobacteraceae bacterium]
MIASEALNCATHRFAELAEHEARPDIDDQVGGAAVFGAPHNPIAGEFFGVEQQKRRTIEPDPGRRWI